MGAESLQLTTHVPYLQLYISTKSTSSEAAHMDKHMPYHHVTQG